MLICQVAKEKYLVEHTIARVNNPRNLEHFELLGVPPGRVRDRPDPAPDRARGATPRPRAPARPAPGAARDHRARGGEDAPAAGTSIGELELPEGCLVVSVLRDGTGFVPKADTVVEAGDEVLAVLNPGDEPEVCRLFGAYTAGRDGAAPRRPSRRAARSVRSAACGASRRRRHLKSPVLAPRRRICLPGGRRPRDGLGGCAAQDHAESLADGVDKARARPGPVLAADRARDAEPRAGGLRRRGSGWTWRPPWRRRTRPTGT